MEICSNKNLSLYKISDIIKFEFLKIPKSLFANPRYKAMSSDAKLAYALLYDRLSLSKQNSWINENNEVYLIYTREEIADELGISYKKAIAAFREMTDAGLIFEKRCGRGMANRIFIAKPEITVQEAREYTDNENSRTAKSACLEKVSDPVEGTDTAAAQDYELPKSHIKNFCFDISRTAEPAYQELPFSHPIKTNSNYTDLNHTDSSQSFRPGAGEIHTYDREGLNEILSRCYLDSFDQEVKKIFYDAIERLFYCESFKVGSTVLPGDKVRQRLSGLEHSMLDTVLYKLHQNRDRPVRNITAYVMSTIFNSITEEFSLLHVDPYLNSLRG